jgi:hypothetical protein
LAGFHGIGAIAAVNGTSFPVMPYLRMGVDVKLGKPTSCRNRCWVGGSGYHLTCKHRAPVISHARVICYISQEASEAGIHYGMNNAEVRRFVEDHNEELFYQENHSDEEEDMSVTTEHSNLIVNSSDPTEFDTDPYFTMFTLGRTPTTQCREMISEICQSKLDKINFHRFIINEHGEYGLAIVNHVFRKRLRSLSVELAPSPKKNRRGGLRVRRSEQGYCYLKLFPKFYHSQAIIALGRNPRLKEVWEFACGKEFRRSGYRLFCHSSDQAHVIHQRGVDTLHQFRSVVKVNPDLRVGAIAPISLCPPEVIAAMDHENPYCDDPEEIDMPVDFAPKVEARALPEEIVEVVPEVEEESVGLPEPCVGAPGFCWRKIRNLWTADLDNPDAPGTIDAADHATVSWLLSYIGPTQEKHHLMKGYMVKWQMTDDGDVHIEEFYTAREGLAASKKRAADALAGIPPPPFNKKLKTCTGVKFVEMLVKLRDKFLKGDLLVGKASVSPYDRAAATYRVPENTRTIEALRMQKMTEGAVKLNKICPWAIPVANQHHADTLGIPWSISSPEPHSHPIHAALRRRQLYEVLPKHIRTDVTCVSLQQGNYAQLCEGIQSVSGDKFTTKLVNPVVDIKDISRYASQGGVPMDVFSVDKYDTPTVLMSDSGHYLTPHFMLKLFAENPIVQYVVVTHVFPLAALSTDYSPQPTLYHYRKVGDNLIYIPEGDSGGSYQQPLDPSLLLARTIHDPISNVRIVGGVVDSKLNSHVQVWQRFHLVVPSYIPLLVDAVMPVPRVFRAQPKNLAMIPVVYYQQLFMYAKTIVGPTEKDLWGKMRQFASLEEYKLPLTDMTWLIAIVLEVAQWDLIPPLQNKFYNGFFKEMYYKTVGHVVRFWDTAFGQRYANRHRRIINEPHPFQLIPCIDVKVTGSCPQTYGLQWSVPVESQEDLFTPLHRWFRDMLGLADKYPLKDYVRMEKGVLLWNHHTISLTETSYRKYGPTLIRANNIKKFLDTFEGGVPNPMVKNEYHGKDKEEEPDAANDSDSSDDSSKTVVWSDRWALMDGSDPNLAIPISVPPTDIRCCERCPTYLTWSYTVNDPSEGDYRRWCDSVHGAEQARDFAKAEKEKREKAMTIYRPAMMPNRAPVSVFREGSISSDKTTSSWQKVYDKWLQFSKEKKNWKMPGEFDYHGSTLWNALYPLTTGKRYQEVPFYQYVCYPDKDYPKNHCLLQALHRATGFRHELMFLAALRMFPKDEVHLETLSNKVLDVIALQWGLNVHVTDHTGGVIFRAGINEGPIFNLILKGGHYTAARKQPGMLLKEIRPVNSDAPDRFTELIGRVSNLPMVQFKEWTPEFYRAEKYIRAQIDKTTGTLWQNPASLDRLKGWEDQMAQMAKMGGKRYLAVIEGDPGCRKSSSLQKILRESKYHQDNLFTVVAPTQILRDDWRLKLDVTRKKGATGKGTPAHFCATFEKIFAEQWWGWLMVRDEDKFPKGHLAKTALLFPWVKHHVMLGDRYQSHWHEPNDQCELNNDDMLGEMEFYSQYTEIYLVGTWRFGPGIANFFRMPTFHVARKGSTKTRDGFHFSPTDIHNAAELHEFFPHETFQWCERMIKKVGFFYAADVASKWAAQLKGAETTTFAGTQGTTYPIVVVQIDGNVLRMASYNLIYTVLTRANHVIILTRWLDDGQNGMQLMSNKLLSVLYKYRAGYKKGEPVWIKPEWTVDVKSQDMIGPLPGHIKQVLHGPPDKVKNRQFLKPWIPESLYENYLDPDDQTQRGGYRILHRDDPAYLEAYNFLPFMTQVDEPEPAPVTVREGRVRAVKIRTHLPIERAEMLDESIISQFKPRFDRELEWKNIFSTQLPDEYKWRRDMYEIRERLKRGKFKGKNKRVSEKKLQKFLREVPDEDNPLKFKPMMYSAGLDQKASDHASFAAGVAQRIRRMSYEDNFREFRNEEAYGNALHEAFKKLCGLKEPVPFDNLEFEKAIAKFQERRNDRSQTLKKMALPRADPLFSDVLSAKTQWKLKSQEAENAKPLQTLLIRSDAYVFYFGPVGIYLLDKLLECLPDNVYLHAKKSVEDMVRWVAQYDTGGFYEMNDVSGFDTTVRGASVHNMAKLMQFFNIPQQYVDDYVEDKLDFHTSTMHFGIMTFSGEIFTWLGNTVHSLSREALKYDLSSTARIMGSGDDVLKLDKKPIAITWKSWEEFDPSIDKRFESEDRGEFCSNLIMTGKVFKDPVVLYRRLKGHIEQGKLVDVYDGYFLHALTIYNLGDQLYSLLTPYEMMHAQALFRVFFNLRRTAGITMKVDWSAVEAGLVELPESISDLAPLIAAGSAEYQHDPGPAAFTPQETQYTRVEAEFDYYYE